MIGNEINWVDEIYHYGEAIFEEPQRINRQANKKKMTPREAIAKLKRWEVSLNIPFNILMRLLPLRIKEDVLNSFLKDKVEFKNPKLTNIYSIIGYMDGLTQPDATLSSENSNLFIELKIDANITLQQVTKYFLAHSFWTEKEDKTKKNYLLFLGKDSLKKQWVANERSLIFGDGDDDLLNLRDFLIKRDISEYGSDLKDQYKKQVDENKSKFKQICESTIIGWSSWKEMGDLLKEKSNNLDSVRDETVKILIEDFLDELKERKLWG
jgi:hypothetical protein